MASTKYTVNAVAADGTVTDTELSRNAKPAAIELATKYRNDHGTAVQVVTGTGTEVFALKAPGTRVIRNKTPQYTRIEKDIPEGFKAPKGTTPAYGRKRAGLVVCRKDDHTGYIVVEVATGTEHVVSGTRQACILTSELGAKDRVAKAAAADAAKVAKAADKEAAKVAKDAAAADAKAAKDAAAAAEAEKETVDA
jgi:hypothetical protein